MAFESISNSMSEALNTPLSENTALALTIGAVIGGIVGQVLKFVFEHLIPEWQRRKATKIAIQKYSQPINLSAITLGVTIERILSNSSSTLDNNEKVSLIYNFGSLLGWIQVFLNESFSEGIEIPHTLNRAGMAKYQYYLTEFLNGISYDYFLSPNAFPDIVRTIALPRFVLNAIGELMTDKTNRESRSFQKVINLDEFSKNYQESAEFRKWFAYLENIIFNVHKSATDPRWNMLILIKTHATLFFFRNAIKISVFPQGLVPSHMKILSSIILWLPHKIDKWFSVTRTLVNIYKIDKSIIRQYADSRLRSRRRVPDKGKRKRYDERFYSILMKGVVKESKVDFLRYTTVSIMPSYVDLFSSIFAKKAIKTSLINMILPYVNERFLDDQVFRTDQQ